METRMFKFEYTDYFKEDIERFIETMGGYNSNDVKITEIGPRLGDGSIGRIDQVIFVNKAFIGWEKEPEDFFAQIVLDYEDAAWGIGILSGPRKTQIHYSQKYWNWKNCRPATPEEMAKLEDK